MEATGLCQWCENWAKDRRGRMGTCMVLRKLKIVAEKRRGSSTVMKTLTTRIATHADDGCEDHFVERTGLFGAVEKRAAAGKDGGAAVAALGAGQPRVDL